MLGEAIAENGSILIFQPNSHGAIPAISPHSLRKRESRPAIPFCLLKPFASCYCQWSLGLLFVFLFNKEIINHF
jgi:hypothetical protein